MGRPGTWSPAVLFIPGRSLLLVLAAVIIAGGLACGSTPKTSRSDTSPVSAASTGVERSSTSLAASTVTVGPTTQTAGATGTISIPGDGMPLELAYPDLAGEFPSSLEVRDQVLHLRSVSKEITSPVFQTDFWQQPATGKFRAATSSPGDEHSSKFNSIQVFTGERLQGYQAVSGEAYDWSYTAYKASILEDKIDPFSREQGEIGERVAELRQAIGKGLLHEAGRGEAGGREIVRYEGKFSEDYPFRRVVLADAATGFPLDDRMYREDGVLFSCRLADLEVVDHPDVDALFSLTFPAGVKPATDEQLPQMPEQAVGLEACQRELAKLSTEVSFPLYYLGESFGGLPLNMVRPGAEGEGSWLEVSVYYRDPASTGPAMVGLIMYDPDLLPRLKKPGEGWTLVRTVQVDGHKDKIYDPGSGGLIYVAERGRTSIDLFGWNDKAPASADALIAAAKSLKPFPK